jgi:hypothetical protein
MIASLGAGTALYAAEVQPEFENVKDFTDFSISGLSEEKTLRIFQAELDDALPQFAEKHLRGGERLVIRFTDVDMAGDIQPWRNSTNADIRYVEAIYPPRLKFRYQLTDSEGAVVDEGEDSISDMAFQMSTAAVFRGRFQHFAYELELLESWMRKTFGKRGSESEDN